VLDGFENGGVAVSDLPTLHLERNAGSATELEIASGHGVETIQLAPHATFEDSL
jgi:hypothetical protein